MAAAAGTRADARRRPLGPSAPRVRVSAGARLEEGVSTEITLPSGIVVTRFWNKGRFLYAVAGDPVNFTAEDLQILASVAKGGDAENYSCDAICTCSHVNDVHGDDGACNFPGCGCVVFALLLRSP
jgi:hypothetical protein